MSYWLLFLTPTNPKARSTSYPKRAFLASVPLSMISILVITPKVLLPVGSSSLAIWRASDVDISILAGITHSMMVLSSFKYLRV